MRDAWSGKVSSVKLELSERPFCFPSNLHHKKKKKDKILLKRTEKRSTYQWCAATQWKAFPVFSPPQRYHKSHRIKICTDILSICSSLCSRRDTRSKMPRTTFRWLLKVFKKENSQLLWATCADAPSAAQYSCIPYELHLNHKIFPILCVIRYPQMVIKIHMLVHSVTYWSLLHGFWHKILFKASTDFQACTNAILRCYSLLALLGRCLWWHRLFVSKSPA